MKKYLVALAAIAMVFASCGPQPSGGDETELTGISFKQTEVSMLYGDTVRLALLATPAEAEIPATLTVESSDTNVVKVLDKRVNIVAVGSGTANIIAKVGDLKAVCQVTAHYYEEAWNLDWIYYFPSTKTGPLNDSIYTVSGYKCRLYSVEYFCPNSLEFAEDLSYGEGDCLFATVSALFVEDPTAGDLDSAMVARQFSVVNTKEDFNTKPFSTLAGKMDPDIIGPVFQEYLAGGEEATIDWDTYETGVNGGAHIGSAKITESGSISYQYLWDGVVVGGWAARLLDQEAKAYYIDYNFGAQWCYGLWGIGLAINPEADENDPATWLKQPFELALSDVYQYKAGEYGTKVSGNQAPARKTANAFKAIKSDKKNWKTMEKPVKAVRIEDLKK